VIAWGASYLAQKKPSEKFTYGFKKSPILGAQLNSLLLLVAIGVIIWEAINRLSNPELVEGNILILVAGFGVIINGITTYLFHGGKDSDLNIKGAYLHMLADTLISVGVVISGILIIYTNASWIDPVISIIIVVVIFWSTWKLLQDATKLSLDGVPENINLKNVKEYFKENKLIKNFHHLHIWALSTSETALTVHIVSNDAKKNDELLAIINHDLLHNFNIEHATIQIEDAKCEHGC
jgi:cobalt-zinc-cadmium efflux system protein